MTRHTRLRFFLPTALAVVIACIYLPLQGRSAPALDGNGPDPRALGLILLMGILGVALALSTLYALVARPRAASGVAGRTGAVAYHLALWLALAGVVAAPRIRDAFTTYRSHQAAAWKAPDAVAQGALGDIERYYAQARGETDDIVDLNARMATAALTYSRVDVLTFLKGQGMVFAAPGGEEAWIGSILTVLNESRRHQPRATFETVRWLMGEGAPLGFSLKAKAADFSRIDLYFSAYEAIDDPATRELLALLVAHGADTVGCKDAYPCPLVYLAGKGMTASVRYLLAQGANPDSESPDHDDTALSAAIRSGSPDTVKALLEAGARPR